jgi:hypothetical protein
VTQDERAAHERCIGEYRVGALFAVKAHERVVLGVTRANEDLLYVEGYRLASHHSNRKRDLMGDVPWVVADMIICVPQGIPERDTAGSVPPLPRDRALSAAVDGA